MMPSGATEDWGSRPEGAGDLLGGQRVDGLPVEQHAALAGLEHAGQGAQQGGLAAGVGADDDGEGVVRYLHRQMFGDDPLVVGQSDVLGGQAVHGAPSGVLLLGAAHIRPALRSVTSSHSR
ncbi:hypothetical protein GCM10019016_136690 [Streptomyces prasinosporus]|uniref:Uncharacterized protein n=1 Tax=Streptomyces prasinosporus TaxID=68256 RepID=A0ABP6UJ95_9ACTN